MREVRQIFDDKIPVIFQVMEKRGLLKAYWPMLRKIFLEGQEIEDEVVVHAFMAVLSAHCWREGQKPNGYCFVFHSYVLLGLGLSEEEIFTLVRELKLPKGIKDHERWSKLLLFAWAAEMHPEERSTAIEYLRVLTRSPQEYDEICSIIAAMRSLNAFAEFYRDTVSYERERIFYDSSSTLKMELADLVSFYTDFDRLAAPQDAGKKKQPVVVLCAECKKIRDSSGHWNGLEAVLPVLDRNVRFSHGLCPDCHVDILEEYGLLRQVESDRT